MSSPFHRLRQSYGDMSLQSKFTIVLILAVSIPVIMIGIFFYSRLYDMVVSYTIGQEQDSSSRTAPLIEERVQNVLDAVKKTRETFTVRSGGLWTAERSQACRSIWIFPWTL